MGALNRRAAAWIALAFASASVPACFPRAVPVRIEAPAGATFRLEAGTFHEERALPAPFQASFGISGSNAPYSFIVRIPADVAQRYGAQTEVVLYATLWTLHRVDDSGSRALRVALEDDAIRAVISGERPRVTVNVRDPNGNEEPALRFTLSRTREAGSGGDDEDRPRRRAPDRNNDEGGGEGGGRQISSRSRPRG